jgi:hypothetical protein
MKSYYLLICYLAFASTSGCSADNRPVTQACGETFCIHGVSQASLAKTTPVEDFNLYRIRAQDRLFVIYEGNNPQSNEVTVGHLRANEMDWDMLRGTNHVGARTSRGSFPQYLVVTTACSPNQECPIEDFIRDIHLINH